MMQKKTAKQKNNEEAEKGSTARYCKCTSLATLGVGHDRRTKFNPEGVERWLCQYCFDKEKGEKI